MAAKVLNSGILLAGLATLMRVAYLHSLPTERTIIDKARGLIFIPKEDTRINDRTRTHLPDLRRCHSKYISNHMSISDNLKAWAKRIKRDGVTLWFACKHLRTPWYAKALGMFVVAYALSPIDLIPDFIPVLGYLDDVLLLPGLIWLAVRLLPAEVLAECRTQADEWMQKTGSKPTSLVGATLIIVLWLTIGAAAWFWLNSSQQLKVE